MSAALSSGATPDNIARSLAVGVSMSFWPVPGTTTVVCGVLAYFTGLHGATVQLVQWTLGFIQLATIIPLAWLGAALAGESASAVTVGELAKALHEGPIYVLSTFSTVLLHAVLAWCLLALPVTLAVYSLAFPVLRRRKQG